MAKGRRKSERQESMWIAAGILTSPGHPFYAALNRALAAEGFDRHVEGRCEKFYAKDRSRPDTPPGVYFRLLLGNNEDSREWHKANGTPSRRSCGRPLAAW